ncbi:MAG: hypothetical protein FJ271_13390 [Planctomycetes bacterium]|nr:hypothetical protein [Planctomycetota bacterium]
MRAGNGKYPARSKMAERFEPWCPLEVHGEFFIVWFEHRPSLRIDDLRVYYDIAEQPEQRVTIVAVGIKDRNRVLVGGKEWSFESH